METTQEISPAQGEQIEPGQARVVGPAQIPTATATLNTSINQDKKMKAKKAPKKRSELIALAIDIIGKNEPMTSEEFTEKISCIVPTSNPISAMNAIEDIGTAIDALRLGYLDDDECLCLSPAGKRMYETKQPHPYADLLDGKPDARLEVIEAALDSLIDAPALAPCDPERAKALLKKVLGEELHQYATIVDADEYYPAFGLGTTVLHFCQGATPDDDFFTSTPDIVRSLPDLGKLWID